MQALLDEIGAVLDDDSRSEYESAIGSIRSYLDDEAFTKAWQEGWAMGVEQAIAYALEDDAG